MEGQQKKWLGRMDRNKERSVVRMNEFNKIFMEDNDHEKKKFKRCIYI